MTSIYFDINCGPSVGGGVNLLSGAADVKLNVRGGLKMTHDPESRPESLVEP
jgi:hypothetical protein